MRALLLALVVACAAPALAQTDAAPAAPEVLRTFTSASDSFEIALPTAFEYVADTEVESGVRVHVFRETVEGGRTVSMTTFRGLDAEDRALLTDGVARSASPDGIVVPVTPADLGLTDDLAATVILAFSEIEPEAIAGFRIAGVRVWGCLRRPDGSDASRCYALAAQGRDDGTGSGMPFAGLLAGMRFTD